MCALQYFLDYFLLLANFMINKFLIINLYEPLRIQYVNFCIRSPTQYQEERMELIFSTWILPNLPLPPEVYKSFI